jgi:hypothetical protein
VVIGVPAFNDAIGHSAPGFIDPDETFARHGAVEEGQDPVIAISYSKAPVRKPGATRMCTA